MMPLLVLTLAAAAPIAGDQLRAPGTPLDVHSKAASLHSVEWKTHQIEVCWLDPAPQDAAARSLVRETVHQIWEGAANVRVTGWQACRPRQRAVRIRVGDGEWPRAVVGSGALSSAEPTMFLNFHLALQPSFRGCQGKEERCLRYTAVHEFGHVLGLIHEQNRPDTPAECIGRLAPGQREPRSDADLDLLTGYDPDSLMNYCSMRGFDPRVPLALTPEDTAAIRKLFGDPGAPPAPRRPDDSEPPLFDPN